MSIWFTKACIGAVLRKHGRWMGSLREEGSDEGFSVRKRQVFICQKVHAILSDLPLYRSDARLGPAGKFAVDSVSNAPGSASCLRVCQAYQLSLSLKKSHIFSKHFKFVGINVCPDRNHPAMSKHQVLVQWPQPEFVRDIANIVGFP